MSAPSARGRSLSVAFSFLLLAGAALIVALFPGGDLVALNVVMIGALVVYVRFRPGDGGVDVFEIIFPLSILYFLFFGASSLYIRFSNDRLIDPALRPYLGRALALAVAGYFALLLGYALIGRRSRPSTFARLTVVHPSVPLVTGCAGALGLISTRWQEASMSSGGGISPAISAVQQLGAFYFFGWFLAWYEFWAGRLKGLSALVVLGTLTAATAGIAYMTLGAKSLLLAMLALPGVAFYEVRRKVPLKGLLVVFLVGVFVVFPFFNTYRIESKRLAESDRIHATIQTAQGWTTDAYMDASVFAFLKRMLNIVSITAVIADTGTVVPYKNGETLVLAPIGLLIPRFVWPEKPDIGGGNEFARTFRLVAALDTETLVAPTMLGDLYWNFGVPAVIFGMILVGGGYRWYYQKFGSGDGYEPIRKAHYGMLYLTALHFEGLVAMSVAAFLKLTAMAYVVILLARHVGLVREAAVPSVADQELP